MKLTQNALKNPAGVAVGVAIVLVFGLYSLAKLPVQLFPDIDQPRLSIATGWRAASPQEIESEILEPQEEVLQGLPGLEEMVAQANAGGSFIELTFGLDTDMQKTLIDVISRLNRVPPLPRDASRRGSALLTEKLPGATVRPFPGLELAEPELLLRPDDQRLAEAGWTRTEAAQVVRTLGDGLFLGEYFDGEKRLNVILRADGWTTPEDLEGVPLATPSGAVMQLGELVDVERTVGPSQVRRIDRRRTLTLSVTPPERLSLEEALAAIRQVEPEILAALPADVAVRYGGSASSLRGAVANMAENFAVALLVHRGRPPRRPPRRRGGGTPRMGGRARRRDWPRRARGAHR